MKKISSITGTSFTFLSLFKNNLTYFLLNLNHYNGTKNMEEKKIIFVP
jgi:hypothetical protein